MPGTAGSLPGEFDLPRAVAADAAGNVYVADFRNGRIQEFDSSGSFLRVIGTGGGHGGEFNFPEDVATDAAGNLCVADNGNMDREARFPRQLRARVWQGRRHRRRDRL